MTVKVGDPAPDFELFGERDPEPAPTAPTG